MKRIFASCFGALKFKHKGRRMSAVTLVLVFTLLGGCETVVPSLARIAVAFGQDMLSAASVNYAPRYAVEVEELLAAMASTVTRMEVKPQLKEQGYQPPPPKYMSKVAAQREQRQGVGNSGYENDSGGYDDGAYGDESYGDGGYEDPGYNEGGYGENGGYDEDGYASDDETYDDTNYEDSGYQDSYAAYETDEYGDDLARNSGGYANDGNDYALSLDTSLLALIDGSTVPVALNDGAILRDGRGDPSKGDKMKVHFQANCRCYVYVVGVDSTGFVSQIFPDPDDSIGNPVQTGTDYLMPSGDQWWGLDDQRGIEQIFFIASRTQRTDIEEAVAQLARQPRQLASAKVQPVSEPALVPPTRGLVKVQAPPVALQLGAQTAKINPTSFAATLKGSDLAITRWLRHQ